MKHNFKSNLSIIVLVFAFAFYHILPTCLYYSRPLSKKIDGKEAQQIIRRLTAQVVEARNDTIPRVESILSALKLRGQVKEHPSIPGVINVVFKKDRDAQCFLENLLYGEPSVPIKSAKLHVLGYDKQDVSVVQVTGSLITPLTENDFSFIPYSQEETPYLSKQILHDVVSVLNPTQRAVCTCGYAPIWENLSEERIVDTAKKLILGTHILPDSRVQVLLNTFFSSERDFEAFVSRLETIIQSIKLSKQEQLAFVELFRILEKGFKRQVVSSPIVDNVVDCSLVSPFFSHVEFCAKDGKIKLWFDHDLLTKRANLSIEDQLDLDGWLVRERQRLSQAFHRPFEDSPEGFAFDIRDSQASGKIVLHHERACQGIVEHLAALALNRPTPQSCDLFRENFPICCRQPEENDSVGCFIFSPERSCSHFSKGSVYVVFKGLRSIAAKYEKSSSNENRLFRQDLQNFYNCFAHTDATPWNVEGDQVLEIRVPLQRMFDVWGEDFVPQASGAGATLEVRDIRDRLETLNRIEKTRQSEWVRWHELYRQSKCSMDPHVRLRAPVPHRSAFFENLKLNWRKYSRGDGVLRLGIDFAGGKQLRLAFKDHHGNPLTDKEGVAKVSDELYARLNKLGVSEVSLHQEGTHVHVSIPGSSRLSSEEIIGASHMSFHVVNEKFSLNGPLRYEVQRFLDYIWFTAQGLGCMNPDGVNQLASRSFNNDEQLPGSIREVIAKLKQEGLQFPTQEVRPSSALDMTYSMIAIAKDVTDKTNPLTIVFHNYALEGASLKEIHPEFAAGEGYILNFGVKDKLTSTQSIPTEDLHAWTTQFCQTGVAGTSAGQFSSGRGWRMAVVLDGYVVSDPVLNAPLKDHASVSGNFSYREVNRLATDLKSGSMSFVPEILSEEIVTPELGRQQRLQGIASMFIGLGVLILLMSVYYRFGGIVASVAVMLNLILIWAALQYLDAPLTLTGLAGIILAMGMAVDANVLVFERIREEYLLSHSLAESVDAGYKKAFGAIFDSNLTTILASLLLLVLDTGPIKGFALTLILGIISSMFTALFMTKFFFVFWMRKTSETQLHMMNRFVGVKHDFLKECKRLWMVSGAAILLGGIALGFGAWDSILGMDFKGGYAITLRVAKDVTQVSSELQGQLKRLGLSSRDFRIKRFSSSDKIKIYFTQKALSSVKTEGDAIFSDPVLFRVFYLLSETGIDFSLNQPSEWQNLLSHVSGQFSSKMRQQAGIALLGVFAIILLYVSLRFEWRYAFSAVCALVHDLVATCAVLLAMHFFLQKIQIDLQAVGALMTVLGYSLNNTLIIFDRIREDRREKLFTPMSILINDALQKTLGRTVMTTATTLSVLLILLLVGGGAIFNFAFIMTIGILLGTLSSLYIAPPLLLFMVRKERSQDAS